MCCLEKIVLGKRMQSIQMTIARTHGQCNGGKGLIQSAVKLKHMEKSLDMVCEQEVRFPFRGSRLRQSSINKGNQFKHLNGIPLYTAVGLYQLNQPLKKQHPAILVCSFNHRLLEEFSVQRSCGGVKRSPLHPG